MRWVFWAAVAAILSTYVGYPAWLWLRSRLRARKILTSAYFPSISIVMAVRNEHEYIQRKLENLKRIEYPKDRLEILVVSDGSTELTNQVLADFADAGGVRAILNPNPQGKAACLNDAMEKVRGEIVVFTDVRQRLEAAAVRLLMENFADPSVGCASGELMLGDLDAGEIIQGVGLYWKLEKQIRMWESASGSVVGATGALYAVRRDLLVPLPLGTILDDVYIPMTASRKGSRVVFDPRARAWDEPDLGTRREFSRKVRTLTGNYQLLQLAPWLLGSANRLRFEFVSHKLLRLLVPFELLLLLVASCVTPGVIYRLALVSQLIVYALGGLGLIRRLPQNGWLARIANPAFTFVLLNTAAMVAFANFISARKVVWGRS